MKVPPVGYPFTVNTHTPRAIRKLSEEYRKIWFKRPESRYVMSPNGSDYWGPQRSKFDLSCTSYNDIPPRPGPEVLFTGRINAGKTSLIHTIVGRKRKNMRGSASKKPGSTRTYDFHLLGLQHPPEKRLTLVDAPGYGTLGRSEDGEFFDEYVINRVNLKHIFVLFNLEQNFTKFDEAMLQHLEELCSNHPRKVRFQPILTMLDKINHNQKHGINRIEQTRDKIYEFAPNAVQPWCMTSIRGKGILLGLDEVRQAVLLGSGLSTLRPPRPKGSPAMDKAAPPHLPQSASS